MTKLLLADDHQIILDGLKTILENESGFELVGQARSGREVLNLLKKNAPDIVVMDIEMPEMDGIETTNLIRAHYPGIKILILSMYNRPEFIKQLALTGVDGFVKKDAGKKELLLALEMISEGHTYFDQQFSKALMESYRKESEENIYLTTREKEVLQLLADGLTTQQIADKLFISTHTVESHRKNLLSKFYVNNTPSLVKKALQLNMVTLN